MFKKLGDFSCKTKIVLPILAIFIMFAGILSYLLNGTLSSHEHKRLKEELNILSKRVQVEMEDITAPGNVLVTSLSKLNDLQFAVALKDKGMIGKFFQPILKSLSLAKNISGIFKIYDQDGNIIYSSMASLKDSKIKADKRPLFQRVIGLKKSVSGLEGGKDGLFLRCLAPVTYNGMFAGVLEYDIPVLNVFKKLKGDAKNIGFAWFISKKFAKRTGLKAHPFGNNDHILIGEKTKGFLEKDIDISNFFEKTGPQKALVTTGDKAFSIMPLTFDGKDSGLKVAITVDNTKAWTTLKSAMGRLLIGFFLVALISTLVVNVSISFITRPLFWLMDFMKELSHGRFLRPSNYEAKDELGMLHKMANAVMAGTGKFCWQVKKDIKKLVNGASDLDASTKTLNEESEYLNDIASNVTREIQEAQNALVLIEEATRQLQDTSLKISENVTRTASIASNAQEKATFTTDIIHGLNDSSEQIGNIIQVIKGISEQTNLLALNATIEAARAGEAGKGFAVVANEVKELAKQTSEATDQITKMIESIQNDTRASVKAVDEITGVIAQASELSNEVALSTDEQNTSIGEIVHNLDEAAKRVTNLNETAKRLYDQAQKLSGVTTKIVNARDAVVDSSRELDSFVSRYQVDIKAVEEAERLSKNNT